MSMDKDLDFSSRDCRFCSNTTDMSILPGTCPTSLFRAGMSRAWLTGVDTGASTVGRGMPGEVGGLASGAELMEWAPRLCEFLTFRDSGVRVLVKVIVTEKGSPAK